MSKPNKKRYKLSAVVNEIRAEHPDIEIETDDGQVFVVPPAQLWSDEQIKQIQNSGENALIMARALLGDEYDKFVAAGGTAALLAHIVAESGKAGVGESSAS